MPTTDTRRFHVVGAAALALLGTLLLGACDGGIFGTGDGGPDVVRPGDAIGTGDGTSLDGGAGIDAGGMNDGEAGDTGGTEDGAVDGDTDGGDDGTTTGPDSPSDPVPGATPTAAPLENLEAEGTVPSPRLRLVNASARALVVAAGTEPDEGEQAVTAPVAPGAFAPYFTLPATAARLLVRADGAREGTSGGETLIRLEPLSLAPSSVTTLFVRDADAGSGGGSLDVVALPTRTASDAPGQALVRLVQGVRLTDPDDAEALPATYTLVSSAPNPGGEVELGALSFGGMPASSYVPVPSGDYRLVRASDGAMRDDATRTTLSFAGGEVRTLVILGPDELLSVEDGG